MWGQFDDSQLANPPWQLLLPKGSAEREGTAVHIRRRPLCLLQAPRDGAGGRSGKVGYDRVLHHSKDQHANTNYLTISECAAERLVSWAFASGLWLAFSPDSLTRSPDPCLRVRTCQVFDECFILLPSGASANTERLPFGLVEGNCTRLTPLHATRIQYCTHCRCHHSEDSGSLPGYAETQESMTVGGFWAASGIEWVGD